MPTVCDLQSAAVPIIKFCDFTQQLPLDLSVFAACLRSEASGRGEALRGVVAVSVGRAWLSDPMGHMFHVALQFDELTEEVYSVSWLPAYRNHQ